MKEAYSEKNQFSKDNKSAKEKSHREENNINIDDDFNKESLKIKDLKDEKESTYSSTKDNECGCEENFECEDKFNFNDSNEAYEFETCENEKKKQLKITQLEVKMKEYLFMAQRLQADFDNFRKKTETKIEQAKADGQIEVISKILPALDSFTGAKKMIKDKIILEGLLMVEKQIISALESLKVEKIEAVGKVFDPNLHNALAVIEDSSIENDIVKEEYQSGYKMNDKVIRHSQVIVNKKEEK